MEKKKTKKKVVEEVKQEEVVTPKKKTKKKSSTKKKVEETKPEKVNFVDDGNKYRKKRMKEIENGTFEFFRRGKEKNFLEIPFNEIVNPELPDEINNFCLVKKRTYCNIMNLIIEYNNNIFNKYPYQSELVISYLALKWRIDKKHYKDIYKKDENENYCLDEEGNKITVTALEQFLDDLYNQLFTDNFNEFIEQYVEKNYHLNIDEKNQEKDKKYNPVLQFSDKHCKMLQCISIGMKISIPLILHYSKMYGIRDTNNYLEKSFDFLFQIFSHGIDLYTKLWKTVHSRVVVTKNSDKTYWSYVEIEGNSINKVTGGSYQKLIVDIIPKYELDQNLINLNHVFINNNMDYTFRSNIEINYKPLNLAESEDDVSDFDKLSINTARIDEGEIVLNECNISKTINKLLKLYDIEISKEEFDYYEKGFVINQLQQYFLTNFFSKYFGSTTTLYYCNRFQYIILLIIMKKILVGNNFTVIPSIITGSVKNISDRATLNKKYFAKIVQSAELNEITETQYSFTKNNYKNNNSLIIKMIANIMYNKFFYKEYDEQDKEGEEIKFANNDVLVEEILRFVSMI